MSRVHPSSAATGGDRGRGHGRGRTAAGGRRRAPGPPPAVYTVWKRSSMGFQGTDGFSVYDGAGGLAFRVENYSRRRKAFAGELVLMDGRGTPLLSLRPQILSLHDRWNCYRAQEEEGGSKNRRSSSSMSQQPLFSIKKCAALQSDDETEVYMAGAVALPCAATAPLAASGHGCSPHPHAAVAALSPSPSFRVEGCFSRRSCKIRGSDGHEAARITSKSAGAASNPIALGDDVFSLVVRPGVDAATIMAIVVVMDRTCRRPYTPLACSAQ